MDKKKKESLVESYERIINVGFCIVPYEDLSDIIDINPVVFGTTKDEKIFSIEEVDALFKSQFEQMGNMKPALDRKRIATRISPDGNHGFIVEEITLTLSSSEETNTIFMRASCVMEYRDSQWKLTHWHTSTPVDTENDHWHQEEWKREKEKLQKLVDQQTEDLKGKNRELKIEAALERIRAQAMAMQESSDLLDIVVTMRSEFVNLGHEAHYFWHMRWLPEHYKKAMTSGDGSRIGMVMTLPRHIHGDIEPVAKWEESDDPTHILAMDVETAVIYLDKMISLGDFEQLDPQAPTLDDIRHIGGLTFVMARTTHGEIGFSLPGVVPDPSEEAVETLVRFAGVFDLAYRRFEDLKAAEKQHREAQIELALERVRSKSMAMHKSEELADLSMELVMQVQALGIETWFCAFNIYDDHQDGSLEWGSNGQGTFPKYRTPREGIFSRYYEAGQSGEKLLVNEITEEECPAHYDYLCSLPGVGDQLLKMKDEGIPFPTSQIDHVAFFKYGYIIFITFEPVPESHNIFKRFARVFEQTYTRFLDLQKAEDQTREAEIQLALERVRAKSMAMKTQTDLLGIIELFGQQLNAVDIRFSNVTFIEGAITKTRDWDLWSHAPESETPTQRILIPYIEHPYFTKTAKAVEEYKKTGRPIHVKSFTKNEKNTFIPHYLKQIPGLPDEAQDLFYSDSGELIVDAFFEEITVSLVKGNADPYTEEELEIFERFAKEFRQTYIRFLDIKKAEEQAREAQIESALEKVRSRSLAMHKSDELNEVVKVLFEKMTELEVPSTAVAIQTFTEDSKDMQCFVCGDVGTGIVISHYLLPYFDHPIIEDFHKAREKDLEFYVGNYSKKEKDSFYDVVLKRPELRDLPAEVETMIRESNFYEVTMVPAKKSVMSVNDFHGNPLSESQVKILKRFAKVFDQAYTRFLDLQKAEEQAREAKIEAALEKVRSRSLAMHNSDELNEVVSVLFEKLKELNIPFTAVGIATGIKDSKDLNAFVCGQNEDGLVITNYRLPYFDNPIPKDLYRALDEQSVFFVGHYSKEEKDAFYEYVIEHTAEFRHLPEDIKDMIFGSSTYTISMVAVKNAVFNVNNFEGEVLSDKEIDIIKRFARVFDQAYTRFLDLQKAEAQAKEAEIQLALERVRARSMAMHKSYEVSKVVSELFSRLKELDIDMEGRSAFIALLTEGSRELNQWVDSPYHDDSAYYTTPYIDHTVLKVLWDAKESGAAFVAHSFSKEEKHSYFKHLFEHTEDEPNPEVYDVLFNNEHYGFSLAFEQMSAIGIASFTGKLITDYESEILKRFAKVFEQAYIRFLDLQKAEEQAREAQIEASLEKVRAQSMGMQTSEDLSDVASVMFDQMKKLGGELFSFGIVLCEEDSDKVEQWHNLGNQGMMSPFTVPVDLDYIHRYRYDQWKAGEELFSIEIQSDYIEEHFERMFELPSVKTAMDEVAAEGIDIEIPDWEIDYGASFSHGYLLVSSRKPFEESHIFPRFAKAFDQAYTRFLDLKRAEKQAREAKIEAALEKVRARTMGMQSSDELREVANLLFLEVQALGIPAWSCGYNILEEDKKSAIGWMSSEGVLQEPFKLRLYGEPSFDEMGDFLLSDKTMLVQELGDAAIEKHYEHMKSFPDLQPVFEDIEAKGLTLPSYQINHLCKFTHGFILFITYEPVPDAHDIFKRFTRAFDQTYTRFLDLKRAEAQTREAQIENALEKVRSRSLAMQHPDELVEVAQLLREEMGALGVEELETSSIFILDDSSGKAQCWFTTKDADNPVKSISDQITINLLDTWVGRQMDEFYGSGQDITSILTKGDHRIEWFRYVEQNSELLVNSEFFEGAIPERTIHLCKFSNGFLGAAAAGDISDESWDLMKRATGVFSFAYTRFSDLQKAEESARRARQQASLDRVRADISSMRSADDLNRVTPLVWRELTTLGIPFIRCGVFIMHEEHEQIEAYLSKPDGTSLAVMHLPFNSSELATETVNAWKEVRVFKQHWSREEFLEWGRSMLEQGQVQDLKTYQGAEEAPESLNLHFIPFNQGMLYVGSTGPLNDQEINLSESLSKAFSIAYARYEDFVKLEKAKASIEDALSELKATQSQLVQQEKLASLGQLTAGIAHEIKNPLNFVNNFSDLSIELVEEIRHEILSEKAKVKSEKESSPLEGSGEAERNRGVSDGANDDTVTTDLILEILDDIEANLKTIHKHGSRADSIVKSMLQHSRGGDGKMEPTPLNPLINEYVNLAFHGMRAGNDPINVDIDLQLDDEVGEVLLVSENFSRVILNLVNNAFDAMSEKAKVKSEKNSLRQPAESGGAERSRGVSTVNGYNPKLTIRTRKSDNSVIIEIEDNGPGIPDEIKDKILQPFFTTKKGTQGTGLGLSITNDIVKAHGGEIAIESVEGEKTRFIINIPSH